jgi:hypothetical protein
MPNKSPEPTRVIAFSFIHKISGLPSHRSRAAQLFSLGIKIGLRLELVGLAGKDLSGSI